MTKLKRSLIWKLKLRNFMTRPVKFLTKDLIFACSSEKSKKSSPIKIHDYWYLISTKGEILDMIPEPEDLVGSYIFIPCPTNTKVYYQIKDKSFIELGITKENKFIKHNIDKIPLPCGYIENSKIVLQDSTILEMQDQRGYLEPRGLVFGIQGFTFFIWNKQAYDKKILKTNSAYQYYSYSKGQIIPFRDPLKKEDLNFLIWNHDGTKLAYGSDNKGLCVFDTIDQSTKRISRDYYTQAGSFCWYGNNYIYTFGGLLNVNSLDTIVLGVKSRLRDAFMDWGGIYYIQEIHPDELLLTVVYKDTLRAFKLPKALKSLI